MGLEGASVAKSDLENETELRSPRSRASNVPRSQLSTSSWHRNVNGGYTRDGEEDDVASDVQEMAHSTVGSLVQNNSVVSHYYSRSLLYSSPFVVCSIESQGLTTSPAQNMSLTVRHLGTLVLCLPTVHLERSVLPCVHCV